MSARRDDLDFVIDNGMYAYGSTFARYTPRTLPRDPLPASALLHWSFEHEGVSPEMYEFVRGIQKGTRVNVNAYAVKNIGGRLAWELYHPMFPPTQARLYGGPQPEMWLSELVGDANFFRRLHASCLQLPLEPLPQAELALPGPPYVLSLELTQALVRERRIPGYTLYALLSRPTVPLELPVHYQGLSWVCGEKSLSLEQQGITLEPFVHREAWLDFIGEAARKLFPEGHTTPGDFIVPWLIEDTGRYRVGASAKLAKGGVGIYYCGITFPTFMRFLEEFLFPPGFIRRVGENASRLEHLVFDVLVSYTVAGGKPTPSRASFYGMF